MKNTPLHSAMREWRDHMTMTARAVSLVGAAVVLTVMGPFETGEAMRVLPRLGYWLCIVVLSYSIGYFANIIAAAIVTTSGTGALIRRIFIAAPLGAGGILALILLLNGFALGFWASGKGLAILSANVIIISSIITTVFQIIENSQTARDAVPPPVLDRIPFDKRSALIALSVEDHYVRVYTDNGNELVLMRLADAMKEVGGTDGLQVHRSHWAAFDAISAVHRKGDGAILTMRNGITVPVSRSNMPAIKDAGLLPKAAHG